MKLIPVLWLSPLLFSADPTHFGNIRQLTQGGQNAEAYWSPDGKRLIFQSTRKGYECDQIFIHDEDLVALVALPRGLEDETLSVRRPIRLRILASLGKLADIAKMRGVSRKEKGTQPKHRDQFHLFFNYTEA